MSGRSTPPPLPENDRAPSRAAAPEGERRARLDPRVERALSRMAAELGTRWTVASLAKVAGMSRAAFARRFAAELGVPPLKYLADLRLARAAKLLVEEGAPLGRLAALVGYESEFALSRAFKRKFGEPPTIYRGRHGASAPAIRAAA